MYMYIYIYICIHMHPAINGLWPPEHHAGHSIRTKQNSSESWNNRQESANLRTSEPKLLGNYHGPRVKTSNTNNAHGV